MGLGKQVRQFEAALVWPQVVGDIIANATEVKAVHEGELHVVCRSSTWANELMLLKPKLLEAIAAELGPGVIKDIRFTSGSISPKPIVAEKKRKKAVDFSSDPDVVLEAEKAARSAAENIQDKKLAEKVRAVVRAAYIARAERAAQGWKECPKCGALHRGHTKKCPVCKVENGRQS